MLDALKTHRGLLRKFFITSFSLYTWAASWLAPLVISFHDFLSHFSSPS
jgi:hypothetical protein